MLRALQTTCSASCCSAMQAAAHAKPCSKPSYGGGLPAQAFDPVFTEVDRAVLAELGVRVRNASSACDALVLCAAQPDVGRPDAVALC